MLNDLQKCRIFRTSEIHKILLKGVRGEGRNPGEFRSSQNWVGGSTIQTATFIPPPPHEVVSLLGNFRGSEDWILASETRISWSIIYCD